MVWSRHLDYNCGTCLHLNIYSSNCVGIDGTYLGSLKCRHTVPICRLNGGAIKNQEKPKSNRVVQEKNYFYIYS